MKGMNMNLKRGNKMNGGCTFKHTIFKKHFTLFALLCLSAVFFPAPALPAHAETVSQPSPEVYLSAVVRTTGEPPAAPEIYTIRMTAIDRAPMPDGSRDFLDLTLTGPGTVVFPELVYETVGIYRYTVLQLAGNDPDAVYDESVYQVTVTVTNAEPGDSLKATVVLLKNGEKQDVMEFINDYVSKPLGGGEAPPPYIPEDPPADEVPNPPLVDEPPGGSLIQTGQNKLPVLLLAFAGMALIGCGGLLLCKNEKYDRERRKRGGR